VNYNQLEGLFSPLLLGYGSFMSALQGTVDNKINWNSQTATLNGPPDMQSQKLQNLADSTDKIWNVPTASSALSNGVWFLEQISDSESTYKYPNEHLPEKQNLELADYKIQMDPVWRQIETNPQAVITSRNIPEQEDITINFFFKQMGITTLRSMAPNPQNKNA
jgi:hypothetical protein